MLPLGLVDNLDSLGNPDSLGSPGNQAVQGQAVQDNQAAEEVAQDNQAELGSLLTCLMLHLPELEDGSLGEHLHRVVADLGKLVVDSSHNPAQEEGTGVGLVDLQGQGMVGVHMEEAWNLDRKLNRNKNNNTVTSLGIINSINGVELNTSN